MFFDKKYLWIALAVLILAGAAFAFSGGDDAADEAKPARPVKLLQIAASTDVREARLPAIIEARNSVELSFQVPGLIQDIAVEEGDSVRRGQIIAMLDRRDFQNTVATARAEFNAAQAEYERGLKLAEADAIADSVQDQRKARRDIAQANLAIANKALGDSVIRAPFSGVVAVVHAVEYQSIAPQVPVLTIQDKGKVEAVVEIPSTLIANADRLEIIENTIVLDVAPDQPITAQISETALQADPRTQTFEYKFAFDPPKDVLVLPGMTATVEGIFRVTGEDGDDQHVSIPTSAVIAKDGKTLVWVVDPDTMAVSQREILTSTDFGDTLSLESGLKAGETIVAAGAGFLHDGMTVRPLDQ